jgi:hypothetical protein
MKVYKRCCQQKLLENVVGGSLKNLFNVKLKKVWLVELLKGL